MVVSPFENVYRAQMPVELPDPGTRRGSFEIVRNFEPGVFASDPAFSISETASNDGVTNVDTLDSNPQFLPGIHAITAEYTGLIAQNRVADALLLDVVLFLVENAVSDPQQHGNVLVAYRGSKETPVVTGVGTYNLSSRTQTLYVEALLVKPSEQGRRVGSQLLDGMWDKVEELGLDEMRLQAIPSALPFYTKLGAEIVSEPEEPGDPHTLRWTSRPINIGNQNPN